LGLHKVYHLFAQSLQSLLRIYTKFTEYRGFSWEKPRYSNV